MSKRIHEFAIEAVYAAARARPAIDGLRVYYEANPRGATHDELIAACESALLGGGSGGGSALLCSNPFGRLSEGRRAPPASRAQTRPQPLPPHLAPSASRKAVASAPTAVAAAVAARRQQWRDSLWN